MSLDKLLQGVDLNKSLGRSHITSTPIRYKEDCNIKKLNKTSEEIDHNFNCDTTDSFSTLDGYVFDSKTGSFSYDTDYDETLPLLLLGVTNPNQEDRQMSKPKKTILSSKKT